MRRDLIAIVVSLVLAASVQAQEAESDPAVEDSAKETPTETEVKDDSDLDDQGYAGDEDDDFIPSEDIQSDKSITFPTDI